jgi:hypothetical protein
MHQATAAAWLRVFLPALGTLRVANVVIELVADGE